MKEKLTVKQEAFCREYIKSGNATESYKLAGYSVKSDNAAGVEGHKLLRNPKIQKRLKDRMQEISDKSIVKEVEILEILSRIARGTEVITEVEVTLQGEKVEVDRAPSIPNRIKALELLGKRYAMWTDKISTDEPISITVKRKDD